ncbi:MAG TPA: HlyD family efflux transporter periplasmic adaptor subunit [Solirubrobacteraceae bacterium]|nr:HlyD family efflux transporter periplasmic adaptor subunit [Solirubrobacteraceae bacterium]
MSSRSLARRPRQPLGRRPIPPRSSTRHRGGLTSPRGGVVSRYLPAAVIAAGIIVVVVVAIGQLGTSKSSARTETEIVTAADGVVQSTVSGTGSLEPVTEEDVDFQTSGTLSHVYVKQGEYVHKGQLLATLGDTTAALTLKQAKATLAEARTTLSSDESNESSSSDTSESIDGSAVAEDVSYTPTSTTSTQTTTPGTQTVTTETVTATTPTTTPATTATTPTETTQTTPSTTTEPTETTTTGSRSTGSDSTTGSGSTSSGSTGSSSSESGSTSSSSSSTVTAATVDADKLQVIEDEQTVKEDRQALDQTRLRAPVSGTITSLESIAPGDSVSSGSTSSADSSSDSTSTTASSAVGSSTGSSDSSSSSFAVIDSLKRLAMTVSFTEADINKLKVGQPAVVTLDALSNLELAGKVTSVSSIGTTSDDVTSYDATVTLNQYDSRVKPGMSASAEVVIKQGRGVTVPSGAVTGSGNLATVTEDINGKHATKKVIVGIRGDSRDLIVSGLSSGAELVETETLPSLGSSASTSSSSSSSATGGFSRRGLSGLSGGGLSGGGFPSGGFSGAGGGGPP